MGIAQVGTTQPFGFADGNTGHACNFGSAPSANDFDILCVNSDTVVSTPTGFSVAVDATNNQGAYIFYRKAAGSESSSVTVTTSGNFNTDVLWLRFSGVSAFDVAAFARIDSSLGAGTSNATTAALAGTGELAILFAALSSIGGNANQSTPTWTAGYTTDGSVVQGSGSGGVAGFVAYRTDAGAAAETAQCTGWSGDGAFNRYTLIATFTPSAASGETISMAATAPAPASALAVVSSTVQVAMTAPAPSCDVQVATPGTLDALMAGPAPHTAIVVHSDLAPEGTGSWWQLDDISRDRAQRYTEERSRPPTACSCGEPLRTGPNGELYCPFDGRRYESLGPAY